MPVMTRILALLALLAAGSASAITISYEGDLTPRGGAGSGAVPTLSGWVEAAGGEVDFWRFFGQAGRELSVIVATADPDLAPGLSLYLGTTTALEFEFLNDAGFGGLTFLAAASAPGPGGSAVLADFVLPHTGLYTLAVGGATPPFLADPAAAGPFAYQIAVVSLPASLWLISPLLLAVPGVWGGGQKRRCIRGIR